MTKSGWMDGGHTPMGNWQCTTRFLVAEAGRPSLHLLSFTERVPHSCQGEAAFPNKAITRIDVTHWVLHLQRIADARLRLNLQLSGSPSQPHWRPDSTNYLLPLIYCTPLGVSTCWFDSVEMSSQIWLYTKVQYSSLPICLGRSLPEWINFVNNDLISYCFLCEGLINLIAN